MSLKDCTEAVEFLSCHPFRRSTASAKKMLITGKNKLESIVKKKYQQLLSPLVSHLLRHQSQRPSVHLHLSYAPIFPASLLRLTFQDGLLLFLIGNTSSKRVHSLSRPYVAAVLIVMYRLHKLLVHLWHRQTSGRIFQHDLLK
jgi:hypothetical protein